MKPKVLLPVLALVAVVAAAYFLFFAGDSSPEGVARGFAEDWQSGDYEAACEAGESVGLQVGFEVLKNATNYNELPDPKDDDYCEQTLEMAQEDHEDDLDELVNAEVSDVDESDDGEKATVSFEDVGQVELEEKNDEWTVSDLPFVNGI